jgi:hypothetical protein
LLTVSAAWRLEKYIVMTELTRLRVASAIWFLLVALGCSTSSADRRGTEQRLAREHQTR